jgi:putative membrane protein
MLGSMRKVWPWKITLESQIIRGKEHVLREENVWPLLDFEFGIALLLMLTGFMLVMLLDKISRQRT